MLELINNIRPYLETLYFSAGIVLAGGLVLTYRQLLLNNQDMQVRNKRAAMEKAIEACERYVNNCMPLGEKITEKLRGSNLPTNYSGLIGDFSFESMTKNDLDNAVKRYSSSPEKWFKMLNQLELIASMFISRVADEKTAFTIIGSSYCKRVSSYYDIISADRDEKIKANPPYNNIVILYLLWHPRLKKIELEAQKQQTEKEMSQILERFLFPYGVND